MKRKIRIFSNIAIICLSVCMFAFGVYAASTVSVTTSGTVTFSATGVYARITGAIAGVSETGLTYSELTTNADGTITGDASSWANKNVTFSSGNEITLTITVQNLATEEGRNAYVTLYDIDQPAKLKTTMKVGTEDYLASSVTEIAPEESVTFTAKMTPRDLNASFTVDYEYLLDLAPERLDKDTIASKIKTGVNNADYGTISSSLDATGTKLTLTAQAKGSNKFLGFVAGNPKDGRFVYVNEYLSSSPTSTTTLNMNFVDARAFYAVFYEEEASYDETTYESYDYIYYVGSTYARYNKYKGVTGTEDIPATVTFDGNEYNVAITGYAGGGATFLDDSVTDYVIPEHISLLYDAEYGFYNSKVKNLVIPETVTYILGITFHDADGYTDEYGRIKMYIDSKYVLAQFNYDDLYGMAYDSCGHWYINEEIIDYLQYNEWFSANYTKSASTTAYNGANYYYYTYTPAS